MSALSPKAVARTAAAVAVAAGMAVCLSAGTAQANPSGVPDRPGSGKDRVILQTPSSKAAAASLSLSGSAPRLVGGAAARVSAQYNCPSGFEGYLDVYLTEVTGNVVAQGSGSNAQPLICNGTTHNLNISVVVSNDHPFKTGQAFGQGFLDVSNDNTEAEATSAVERTINIT